MKPFSFKAFAAVAFLHIAAAAWLISAAISRVPTYDRRETFPWRTALSWICHQLGFVLWFPVCVIFWSVQVMRDCCILNRDAQAKSLARPDISAKVGNVALSQLPEITRWKNNRVRGASVKLWLANARGIFPRGVEQQAQSRNLNMGLVAQGNNPVRQR